APRAPRLRSARRRDRCPGRPRSPPRGGDRGGPGAARARPTAAVARRTHRDLHRRRTRRDARRTRSRRRPGHRDARPRRDRVGRSRVARRPARRGGCGARRRDRGPGAPRGPVHAGGGARMRGRVTLGFAALLAAAAARGGPVTVVSDGAIADLADIPPDLARRARIVVLPRTPFFDALVASVEGPRRVAAGDTIRLRVSYGVAGEKAGERPGKG